MAGKSTAQAVGGASEKVYREILRGLNSGELVPGQRLILNDLADQLGVGRNAVREAIQLLAGRGVVDLSRHSSAAIRQLDDAETMEVLDVAEVVLGLLFRTAARRYNPKVHLEMLNSAFQELEAAAVGDLTEFSRARRHFYRVLLTIANNRELQRLFPTVGIHIIHAKYRSIRLQQLRLQDYRIVKDAVAKGDAAGAEAASRLHTDNVRAFILDQAKASTPQRVNTRTAAAR